MKYELYLDDKLYIKFKDNIIGYVLYLDDTSYSESDREIYKLFRKIRYDVTNSINEDDGIIGKIVHENLNIIFNELHNQGKSYPTNFILKTFKNENDSVIFNYFVNEKLNNYSIRYNQTDEDIKKYINNVNDINDTNTGKDMVMINNRNIIIFEFKSERLFYDNDKGLDNDDTEYKPSSEDINQLEEYMENVKNIPNKTNKNSYFRNILGIIMYVVVKKSPDKIEIRINSSLYHFDL
ncbi:MAG: hypothetical protein WBA74_05170 [Cyclobacteriaceae bacterium]